MNSEDQLPPKPAEDRAALREELVRAGDDQRLQLFDALDRQIDDSAEDVPEMPDALRDKLLDRFGTVDEPAMAPAGPGFMEKIVSFFQQKPLASYGGLAVAACAVVLAVVLPNLGGDDARPSPGSRVDTLRGGAPKVTADIPVFLFPESAAGAVVAVMNGGKVTVCADADDFTSKLAAAGANWAVVVDLERRVVWTIEDGEATVEAAVEGESATDIGFGIHAAQNRMVDGR